MADAPVAAPAAVRVAPQGAAQRQPAAPERHWQRPRRRAAGHREEGPSAAATDRRPRRAPVRLVQLEETDAFVSKSRGRRDLRLAQVPQGEREVPVVRDAYAT